MPFICPLCVRTAQNWRLLNAPRRHYSAMNLSGNYHHKCRRDHYMYDNESLSMD